MAQYIDKDALVAEIDRLENKLYYEPENFKDVGAKMALDSLKSSLDTFKVKEVDLEEYYHKFLEKEWFGNSHVRTVSEMMAFTAKHFFELGIKAKNRDNE